MTAPFDDQENTEEHRGRDIAACREIFYESGWEVLEGPSRHYGLAPR